MESRILIRENVEIDFFLSVSECWVFFLLVRWMKDLVLAFGVSYEIRSFVVQNYLWECVRMEWDGPKKKIEKCVIAQS